VILTAFNSTHARLKTFNSILKFLSLTLAVCSVFPVRGGDTITLESLLSEMTNPAVLARYAATIATGSFNRSRNRAAVAPAGKKCD